MIVFATCLSSEGRGADSYEGNLQEHGVFTYMYMHEPYLHVHVRRCWLAVLSLTQLYACVLQRELQREDDIMLHYVSGSNCSIACVQRCRQGQIGMVCIQRL